VAIEVEPAEELRRLSEPASPSASAPDGDHEVSEEPTIEPDSDLESEDDTIPFEFD
jgi:hypothetical protein